jgi:phosphatidylinositol glycan class Q protein
MHPVSVLTFGIFLAGYITARWDLVTRLYELAIFAWDHGVIVCERDIPNVSRLLMKTYRLAPRKDSPSYPYSSSLSSSQSNESRTGNQTLLVTRLHRMQLQTKHNI